MPLRAVFLDIGNTLLDEVRSRYAIYADAATRRGRPVDEATMRARMGAVHRELPPWIDGEYRYSDPWFRAFIARIFGAPGLGFDALEVERITEELFATFESPETFRPFPGAVSLLRSLREAGLTIGVVSNWSARLERVLTATELLPHFDFVLSSALEGVQKPDPEIFRRALARAEVDPGSALHAGDHPELDVAAARAVGLQAVLVDHRGAFGDEEPQCARNLAELEGMLLERAP